jgi:hypothetical protein
MPRILFPKFTHLSYIAQNPLTRLICFGAAGTVMGEELAITLFFTVFIGDYRHGCALP